MKYFVITFQLVMSLEIKYPVIYVLTRKVFTEIVQYLKLASENYFLKKVCDTNLVEGFYYESMELICKLRCNTPLLMSQNTRFL